MFLGFFRKSAWDPQKASDFESRDNAARQLYALLDLSYLGLRSAKVTADLLRAGITNHLSLRSQECFVHLQKRNPNLLDSLLADILD